MISNIKSCCGCYICTEALLTFITHTFKPFLYKHSLPSANCWSYLYILTPWIRPTNLNKMTRLQLRSCPVVNRGFYVKRSSFNRKMNLMIGKMMVVGFLKTQKLLLTVRLTTLIVGLFGGRSHYDCWSDDWPLAVRYILECLCHCLWPFRCVNILYIFNIKTMWSKTWDNL